MIVSVEMSRLLTQIIMFYSVVVMVVCGSGLYAC